MVWVAASVFACAASTGSGSIEFSSFGRRRAVAGQIRCIPAGTSNSVLHALSGIMTDVINYG